MTLLSDKFQWLFFLLSILSLNWFLLTIKYKKIQTVYCIDIDDDSGDDLIDTRCSW